MSVLNESALVESNITIAHKTFCTFDSLTSEYGLSFSFPYSQS